MRNKHIQILTKISYQNKLKLAKIKNVFLIFSWL
jgi:hypothetical protein